MNEVLQEKKDELKNEVYLEQKIRTDFDFALEFLGQLDECVEKLELLSSKLSNYGWEVSPKEIMNHVL